ncbi:armadillo-type protein [Halteromyces radiatus]|uniref:armadillo-type protein n=1 Tax=Halteromyces radiatus TaxID=101107 RepID=UPI00221ED469|nr:armadillo-type protein [Halteromyces radiatus]KAI8096689.1 armadillo-type protein [Halteromyces radiatus]
MNSLHVTEVKNLVEQLYTSIDPQVTKTIQEQLQAIQRHPEAWELASNLLSIPSDHCRFFGAHTIQVKIARDWNTLPSDRIDWLRDELFTWIIKCSNGSMFVTRKLCIALIAYAFQVVPNYWQQFIPQSIQAFISGAQAYGVSTENINQTILEFLTMLPEEISNAELIGGQKSQLMQEFKDGLPLVLSTLSNFLFAPETTDVSLLQKSLKCFQSWIQYGINIEDVALLLTQTMSLLANDELFEAAADVLLEGMQQSSWTRYNSFRDNLLVCFTSDGMKKKFADCIQDEDDDLGRSLAKLFTTFGETFTDFVALQLARSDIQCLMDMTLQLTGFQGYYPVDQEISEIPLNFWYVLQETLFDHGIIPVRQFEMAKRDGDDDVSLDSTTSDEQRLWTQHCGETAVILYQRLVTVIKQKAIFPKDDVWRTWTKDLKDKFRICRRDLGDTIINSYYVLRGDMLAVLFNHIFTVLAQWNTISSPGLDLEATLFCLKSVSEEIPADENEHVAKLFGADILGRLPSENNIRLQNTALSLTGSLAEWLKGRSEFLIPALNYIVPCLSSPKLASYAASAFSNICDICRESLIDDLDSLMHVYSTTSAARIDVNVMHKVVESVASVIQVLPPERSMGPLMILTGSILQELGTLLVQDPATTRTAVLSQLQNLSACCRGIQTPTDDYQTLTARNNIYDIFASGQLTAMYTNVDGFEQMTFAIGDTVRRITMIWGGDEEVMKALSQFLEAGIRSTSPLLTLPFHELVSLIDTGYQTSRFASWLDTTAFVMTVYGGQQNNVIVLRDLLSSLTEKTLNFISRTEDMEEHPDNVDSYFNLLSRVIQRCPMVFYELSPVMLNTIFQFTIAGMGIQERLALKASLNFMADFVAQDYKEGSKMDEVINKMIMELGLQIMEQLLAGIGGRVPRSFSKPLVDVLYKLTGRYLELCRHWLQILLAHEGFPSRLVTKEDKDTFIKGILGHRSLKRFKEYTNEFSKKCRGLGNTSFGGL